MLACLLLTVLSAQAQEPAGLLSSGADLQAWRALGNTPSTAELQDFLETHHASPLAELAVRRLDEKGIAIPTQNIGPILSSLLAHDARLASRPITVAVAPLTVIPLSSEELPALNRPALASAED